MGERHLAASSLYSEDVFSGGHTAVWGSYFDKAKNSWGYACCKTLSNGGSCPLAPTGSTVAVAAGAAPEDDEAGRRLVLGAMPCIQTEPEISKYSTTEEYLSCFVSFWFHDWAAIDGKQDDQGRAADSMKQALLPLLLQLHRKAVPQDLLQQLVQLAALASEREYSKANDVYIGITIGKALWHSHLDLGEQRAHWGQGCSLRTMQKQVVEKDHQNATLFDTDPVVQRYVHAMKRLVTHMQSTRPSEDPAKMGHAPAPKARPDEVGLPVVKGVRDSDGRGHEPEFMEPAEAYAIGKDRGLAFGSESGRAHPFHGIGNARGI